MTYEFQSTSNSRLILFCLLGTVMVLAALFGSILLIDTSPLLKTYDEVVIISLSVAAMAIFWFIGKKHLKQDSTLTLSEETLIFTRDGHKREIRISEIESYKYKLVQGVRLNIWTRRNEKISIIANDVFCKYEGLEKFCSDFDDYVNSIKPEKPAASKDKSDVKQSIRVDSERDSRISETISELNPNEHKSQTVAESKPLGVSPDSEDLIPKRKKSFYEKKYAQPFLIAFTVLLIAFVIYVIVEGGNLPATIITSAGGLSAMWAGYFNHQKK